jgi:hypothetical protein
MNKPKRDISRDIFDVINDNGSATYTFIDQELRRRKSGATSVEIRKALENLMLRQQIERSEHNRRRYIINKAILQEQLTGQKQLNVFKQLLLDKAQEAESTLNESLADNIEAAIQKETRNQPMIFMEYVFIVGISAGVSAITTILMRYL